MEGWASLNRPIQAPRQLLVEGRTAEIFFREWVEAAGLKGGVEVRDYGSIERLGDFLRVFTALKKFREGVTSLGILRDAEAKPAASAFASVCSSLKSVGLVCPRTLNALESDASGLLRVGIFILPDCQQPGMLETLCWRALEADLVCAPQVACVTAYLDCLRRTQVGIGNESKAKVWSYLAGRGQFDPQVGRAAQAKVWNWSSPAFAPLSAFISSL